MVQKKTIEGFEDYYITSDGEIYSYARILHRRDGKKIRHPGKRLKPYIRSDGYLSVTLYNRSVQRRFFVHRLVAQAFIPNPDNLPQVNHKDENKANNSVDNLEWCTQQYNLYYGTHFKKIADKNSRPVMQFTTDNEWIAEYRSAMEAERQTGIKQGTISWVCSNAGQTAGGYKWILKEDFEKLKYSL